MDVSAKTIRGSDSASGPVDDQGHGPPWDYAPELPKRIPSLDGLRAISIGLVILAHLAGTLDLPPAFHHLDHLGNLGVKIFFVISGFLISTLLLGEFRASGRISIKNFYGRRVLRIFPAFFTYFFIILAAALLGIISLRPGDAAHAVTFTMNYHHDRAWYLNHLWSLSVEEQFYLLWPALLLLLGPRRALLLAFAVIFLSPLARAYMMFVREADSSAMTREFQAVADALATGCLLAGTYNWLGRQRPYLALLRSPLFLVVPVLGFGIPLALFAVKPGLYYLIGQTLAHLAIAICIDRSVRFSGDHFGRLLNTPPLVLIGTLSYSLYLWQEPFLNPMAASWSRFNSFPLNLGLTIVCAMASYQFVEKPFLGLRRVFQPMRSPLNPAFAQPSSLDVIAS
jgi:peptidoglycan/LPS O-acetylase OafA/YrhL